MSVTLIYRLRGWPKVKGWFSLGRWGIPVNIVAVIGTGLTALDLLWPRAGHQPDLQPDRRHHRRLLPQGHPDGLADHRPAAADRVVFYAVRSPADSRPPAGHRPVRPRALTVASSDGGADQHRRPAVRPPDGQVAAEAEVLRGQELAWTPAVRRPGARHLRRSPRRPATGTWSSSSPRRWTTSG